MQSVRTEFYKEHQISVTVEKYREGTFAGMWFVLSQGYRLSDLDVMAQVAHEQNNGPFGSEEQAFSKAYGTLHRFVDAEIDRGKARRKALGLEGSD